MGSQEGRDTWNGPASSRREDGLLGQGGDVRKGERTDGKTGEEPRRMLQPVGVG